MAQARTETSTQAETGVAIAGLEDIAALADKHRDVQFKVLLKQHVRLVQLRTGHVEIELGEGAPIGFQQTMAQRLEAWTSNRWFVTVAKAGGGRTLGEVEAERRSQAESAVMADPDVAAVLAAFPGAKIMRITNREDDDALPPAVPDAEAETAFVPSPDEFDPEFDD